MKTCSKCEVQKSFQEYSLDNSRKDRLQPWCKKCKAEHYSDNKIHYRKKQKEYNKENSERNIKRARDWALDNRERVRQNKRNWKMKKFETDIGFKLKETMSSRIRGALKNNAKKGSTLDLLGCSVDEFRKHLQSNFQHGMTWDNYGDWHIDHITPLRVYNLIDPLQLALAFHYTNCQPLWAFDNLSKGSKMTLGGSNQTQCRTVGGK